MNNAALINTESLLAATPQNFSALALGVFHYQYQNNALYHDYCNALKVDTGKVTTCTGIPFLPISFFKTHRIQTGLNTNAETGLIFESSGTTGENTSRHYIADAGIYERSLLSGFSQFYGEPAQYAILALLPSYLGRKNASLVYMANTLMAYSGHPQNGFYIDEWDKLSETLRSLEAAGTPTLLLGVTFALLDFAAVHPMPLRNTIVMETGGMKGRRKEMTRAEVHSVLMQQFGLRQVHSEYGMTELLSQAYAAADGEFRCTNTMQVFVRDINDPLDVRSSGTGVLNIIDLANVHSCSFIATEDLGQISPSGTFQVLGRLDNSALRGCSLMAI